MPEATTATVTRGRPLVVAIDGPSGSGKSSTARGVARRLGLAFLDTGAMYRAATWLALQRGVDLTDTAAVADLVRDAEMDLVLEPDAFTSRSTAPTSPRRSGRRRCPAVVSAVATNLDVRADLVARQKDLIAATPGGSSPRAETSPRWLRRTPTYGCSWSPTRRPGSPGGTPSCPTGPTSTLSPTR